MMASHKSGSAPGRPGESRSRDERISIDGSSWGTIRTDGTGRQPSRAIPQPKIPSRLPQSFHVRRPSAGESEPPRLIHQPHSWDSAGSGSTGGSRKNAPPSAAKPNMPLGQSPKRRNVLRRKQSGLSQDLTPLRNELQSDSNRASSSLSNARSQTPLGGFAGFHFDRDMTQSPMEVRVAQQMEVAKTTPQTVTIYPELDRYRDFQPTMRSESPDVPYRLATHDLPPPTPLFSGTSSQMSGFSGSPSTRFSGSPGPGPYSRDTTPTSISSQSPGLVAPMRIPAVGGRMRPLDPALTRPPVTRRRADSISNDGGSVSAGAHGLASVRESLTSSSSNSTVRDGDKREKKKKKRLSPLPPSPPPRKSSQKFKKSRDEEPSPSKVSREPAQPLMISPSKGKATSSSSSRPALAARSVPSAPTPPARPSRDGTPDLQSDLGRAIPVIQSNLSSTSLPERRQSSLLASAPVGRPIFSSPAPDQPARLTRRSGDRDSTSMHKRTISSESKTASKSDTGRATRTPSPSVSAFKSRFPIFGRKPKAATETTQPDKKEKPARKGPAAGTGHEGYGRLGSVRRKSSSTGIPTRTIPGTMSSQESLGSTQSYDPFFAERMAPVIIAGGEVKENRNASSDLSRTESNQSLAARRPSVESKAGSRISMSSREEPRYTLWPSPFPRGSAQGPSLGSRRPSDSSDSEAPAMRSTLALRRSMQRLDSGEQDAPRIPKPIVTKTPAQPPSITSVDTSIMSDDSIADAPTENSRGARKAGGAAAGPKKLLRRARSPIKWNFFSRSQSQPAAETKKKDAASTVAATVKVVRPKPMAFYTMMDSSEQEDADTPDLEEVLREARSLATPPPEPSRSGSSAETRRPSINQELSRHVRTPSNPIERRPSLAASRAVTSPAKLPTLSGPKTLPPPTVTTAPSSQQIPSRPALGRPSRLPQVGRIPKVVSARAEQTSPKSFSRPFHRLSAQGPPAKPETKDPESVAKGPTPPKPSTPELTQDESATTSGTNISIGTIAHDTTAESVQAGPNASEFLSFTPRKGSCTTTSSTSSGAMFSFADATAVVPPPNAPLAEDEIWDEYNDLLGDEAVRLPPMEPASTMKPVPLNVNKTLEMKAEPSLESPTVLFPPLQSMIQAMYSPKEHPTSSIYSIDMMERVQQTLDVGMEPGTLAQPSLPAKGDRVNSIEAGKQVQKPRRSSNASVRQTRYSSSSGASQGSEDSSPVSQVNLRVGSMTVSKWLTFGHVLFSPVRDELIAEVGSLKRPSILVVDGLGNDDWSFYAAETYPAATFFNLSPRAPLPAEYRTSSTIPLSPPNHHQIQYLSHKDKFPFGAESFTAVVFRFPAAAPEANYRNIVSEARRVLKPGGFIELSILDVDLNNMGNRGRRTVRRLKERIHAKSADTYLGSASDLILRLIGRKGFTDIKTCRVGVPVASPVAKTSSGEAGASSGKRVSTGSGHARSSSKPAKDNRSLPEMISDESPVADESITKMVAKVGRWWYSSCYENAAAPVPLSGSRGGLWNDKPLLSECEEWGTSLKLMVCHARAPDGRARVASI
ncbi:hypothetical protein QBC47DRAFT_19052 [Echria macrotheca]|uniref:Methyltransferase type 11 domain-containing protein n=1 Tax=Echria macrotheca TaxID=438768 RepID=A0AAJ0BMF2_9PEZI|nr:hypothetical protein QBC47DRAFT_19052 [Echria macrotheca]